MSNFAAVERGQNTLDDMAARLAVMPSPHLGRESAAEADLVDLHRNAPAPDEAMLYGLAGDVARAAAATTEANRYAVAAGFLAFLSAAVGRDVYLDVGNTKHHARLFMTHVGRSSRGRKGDALSLVQRIRLSIEDRHRQKRGEVADPFCGGHHHGGLSTREGLALLIHDGYKAGKEDVPPIYDKRLWVIESEFSNVLHQSKRDGNTLSSALRDAWDGISIRPATKTSRVWASNPHIALSTAITPSELLNLIESRELTNGFANRFLIFWAERERLIPFPKPTPQHVVEDLVDRTMKVIDFALGNYPDTMNSTSMELSDAAQAEYERLYRGELTAAQDGERVTAILERRAPILLRLSMLFALTNLTYTIGVEHLRAALAWARFHRDSVRFIFNDAAGEEAARESSDAAGKIVEHLRQHGQTSRADLYRKCFGGHLSARRIDDALDALLMESPPRIEVVEGPRLENGKRTKFYGLVDGVRTSRSCVVAHAERDSTDTQTCAVGVSGTDNHEQVRNCAANAQLRNDAESLTNRPTTPDTPSTHTQRAEVEL